MSDGYLNHDEFILKVSQCVAKGDSISVEGTGDSMLPFIQPETDKIILSPLPQKLRTGDICMYLRGTRPIIHRIYKAHKNTTFDMLGDGQMRIDYGISKADVIAIVTSRIRDGRPFDCTKTANRINAVFLMKKRVIKFIIRAKLGRIYGKIKARIQKER